MDTNDLVNTRSVETLLTILFNVVRIGQICKLEEEIRVVFPDKSNLVSGSLKVMHHEKPWTPELGDNVICLYLPHGEYDGFIIGRW